MGYEVAFKKAYDDLLALNPPGNMSVKFLGDEYSIDIVSGKPISLSCNVPVKDFTAILILHYLARKINGLPALTGEWLTFRELSGVEGYLEAFKKRSIEPIIRKYGGNPEGIFTVLEKLPARKINGADASIVVDAFQGVPVLIKIWRKDEDFAPDANIFFDRSVTRIFCTEDIVVLAGMVAHYL